jgi:D-lactate dehydrogenase (cytochrome)
VKEQAETVEAIATDAGGAGFAWATDPEARNKLWKARHDAYWAAIASKPGSRGIATDVCLPISHLAEALLGAKEDIAASGFSAPMVGHVGDGNFHTVILVEDDRPETLEAAWALDKKIVHRALALGGTCSGEHGVGLGKREFLEVEHGMEALSVMLSVKHALDPKGILNPGKIFRN